MDDAEFEELMQERVLAHALEMGGWLAAESLDPDSADAIEVLLLADPPLFEFVDDPDSVPHQRFHLTAAGIDLAWLVE